METRRRRLFDPIGVIAAVVLASGAYFYQAGGWNQNARFDLARAIGEQGTIRIDAYHTNTGDKSRFEGHFYSNKAPGQSFAAVPVTFVAARIAAAVGADPGAPRVVVATSHAATVLASALPAASLALLLGSIARRREVETGAACWVAVALCLGTPIWAYATMLVGQALAAAGLLGALLAAEALRDGEPSPTRDVQLGALVGAAAGMAVLTEYTALVPAAMLALYGLVCAVPAQWLRVAGGIALGAGGCAAVLFAYHMAAFGSPFATPLDHLYLFPRVREQMFSWPSLAVLGDLLFGAKRGLLPLAPVLGLAVVGFVRMLRDRATRALGILCLGIVGYYALMNAAFATPMAGWSYGPRYMGAALPFWSLGVLFAWQASRDRIWRASLVVLTLWGVGCSLVAVSTTVQPPERYERPMAELLWPAFVEGDLSLNHQSFLEYRAEPARLRGGELDHEAYNLGELAGLGGHASLVPLLALWLVAAYGLARVGAASRDDVG